MKARIMLEMTVEDVAKAVKESPNALLPVGLCEQHGFHLPLGTDLFAAEEVSRRVAERFACIVAPSVNFSFSGGMLPGTINIDPHVISLLIKEAVLALHRSGFRRVGIVMGHGGSEAADAIKQSLRILHWLHPGHSALQVVYLPYWEFSPSFMQAFKERDYHAGYIETSLMMYWRPELVRESVSTDKEFVLQRLLEDPDGYQQLMRKTDSRYEVPHTRQHPEIEVGVMGFPEKASVEMGKKVSDEIVENIVKELELIDRQTKECAGEWRHRVTVGADAAVRGLADARRGGHG